MVSDKQHSIYTHFSKDRICEICHRTKITTFPRRRRMDGVLLRAEYFGDVITADHKVLFEGCVSRNNHRYAVVVQDLTTQRIQSYQCKTKTYRKLKGAWKSSWSWPGNQKTFTLSMSWSLAKSVKVCRRIIVRRPHTVQKQMEEYVELKKGHLLYWCNQVWMKKGADSMKCYCYLSAKYSRYLVWWEDTVWKAMNRAWDPGGGGPAVVAHAGTKNELTSCRGTVLSAWQNPPVSRKEGRTELPARVNGRHVVWRRQSSPIPVQEPAVNRDSKVFARVTGKAGENGQHSGEKRATAHPGQDRRLPSVVTHSIP